MADEITDTPIKHRLGRRGLFAGAAALAATALVKFNRAAPAEAADGQAIVQGILNTATTQTQLRADGLSEPTLSVLKGLTYNGLPNAISARSSANAGALFGETGYNGGISAGVVGESFYATGVGVYGYSATGGQGYTVPPPDGAGVGVYGHATQSRTGVKGVSSTGIGVRGESLNGTAVSGGSNNAVGVFGASDANVGVRGVSYNFVGIVGTSTNSIGIYASNATPYVPALYAENLAGSGQLAGYFQGGVLVTGNFQVMGAKNALVKMADGSHASVYCQESPEPYFEDFGRANLAGGVAQVALEPEYASLVSLQGYMVFLTPAGDCKGLYVSRQDQHGFEVRELQAGTSSVAFTYRIVAKRKDIPGKRLERLDPQIERNVASMKQKAADKLKVPEGVLAPGAPSGPGNGPR